MIHFCGDFHFGHRRIIDYCNRPFKTVEEMDQVLIDNFNAKVKPCDMVYILGDFSFHTDRYIDKLNGYKILIKGHHDNKKYDKLFDEVYDRLEISIGVFKCLLSHYPYYYNNKVAFVITAHVHNDWKVNGNNINVGVDVNDFSPISFDELKKFLYDTNLTKLR